MTVYSLYNYMTVYSLYIYDSI